MPMASPFYYQNGFPNISLLPPPDSHHIAPFPNMETSPAATAKRGPEDDVQFVAAHPVKKCRDSREQPQKPTLPVTLAAPPPEKNARGNSLPTMENFTFPPLNSEVRSQTSQSSPLLSPRQLPTSVMPNHTNANIETATTNSTTATGTYGPVSQKEATIPWHMPGLPSHFVLINQSTSSSQPTGFAPFHPPNAEQHPAVRDHEEPRKSPEGTKGTEFTWPHHNDVGCHQQETSPIQGPAVVEKTHEFEPQQPKSPQDASSHTDQPQAHIVMPCSSITEAQPVAQHSASTIKEAGLEAHPQETIDAGNNMLSNPPHPSPSELPCLACEQTRQHAIVSQGNGYLAGHQPQLQYPWHGPGVTQQQMQMGHQLPASVGTGFNVANSVSQNVQPKAHGTPANHAPPGYIFPPQLQSQMPMTLTRPFTTMGMPGSESLQGILLQNQGQQLSPSQLSHLSSTYPQHLTRSQYLPPQLSSFQQPLMMPRSFMASPLATPTQAPVAPPQPSPTTSDARALTLPEPREHSPNLIVDIAETCEDLFPWEEVAHRHNVPRQKVIETFSAVVQLPLLRCTTDKRRHGNLATSRLRQYTKAKRDVEAAKASSSTSPPSPTTTATASSQTQSHGDRAILPVVWEMANTMAPLGLPSSIANGLTGSWQR